MKVEHFEVCELLAAGTYKFRVGIAEPRVHTKGKGCIHVWLDTELPISLGLPLWGSGAWYWGPILREIAEATGIDCPERFTESREVIDLIGKLRDKDVYLPVRVDIRDSQDGMVRNTVTLERTNA